MSETDDEIRGYLSLAALPGLGCVLIHRLVAVFGSPQAVLAAGRSVANVEGIGPKSAAIFENQRLLVQVRSWAIQEQERAATVGIQLLCCTNPQYPSPLKNIHDPPVILWCRGDLDCFQ